MNIRQVEPADAPAIADIYNHYVATSPSTFELEPIDASQMLIRINESLTGEHPFLVALDNQEIIGYAYGHQFKARAAYAGSLETSIYILHGRQLRGIGTQLYEKLFNGIRAGRFHTVIAGISLPNDPSIRLHEKFGFVKVGHLKEVGWKFGQWIDVGYWQKMLTK